MSNDAYIDDEQSYLQQLIENEEYEYWLFVNEQKEYQEYLAVLARSDEHEHF